jgi:hypothetical protein
MKHWLLALVILAFIAPSLSPAQEQVSTKEQIDAMKGALDGLNESFTEYRGYVDALRKIKVTGYIQSQWRTADVLADSRLSTQNVTGTFSGGAFSSTMKNNFQVRRGRLKVTYDNVLTQYVLQFDAVQTGLSLKDAYVMVTEPWTKSFGLQAGVFDRPFGYEISYSSSNRETPERSRLFQSIFPGERELGMKLFWAPPTGPLSFLRADVGVFNGSGPTANEFDNYKDLIGHVAAQFPMTEANAEFDLGASGYFGNVRNATKFVYLPGTLANGQSGFVADSAAVNLGNGVSRQYVGFDAQFYYDLPVLGGLILRGEYITGKQPGLAADNRSSIAAAQPSAAMYRRDFSGYYVTYVQNVGTKNQFIAKYDNLDPNSKVGATDFTDTNTSGATGLTNADVAYNTLGLGWVHYWDDNVKFVFYYENVTNEKLTNLTKGSLLVYKDDVRDNVFTFRVQYKF